MEPRSDEILLLEEGIVNNAATLIEEYGLRGILAVERAMKRIREHNTGGSILFTQPPLEPKVKAS